MKFIWDIFFYPSEATDCACRIHLVSHLFIFL